jgi:Tol biopolymer transport system component
VQSRNLTGQTYPNGRTRRELFAVRDDGMTSLEVQLTNQPDLENNYWMRWSPGDSVVTFGARRWDLTTNQIVEGGVYAVQVAFDAAGNLLGPVAAPTSPFVAVALIFWPANLGGVYAGEMGPDLNTFAWSPVGTQIVYETMARTTLRVATIGGGVTTILTGTWCAVPEWSPAGSPIAYTNQQRGISTVRPDGTNLFQLSRGGPSVSYSKPCWSPTGSHIAYDIFDQSSFPYPQDVGRMTAAGKTKANLTSSLATGGAPIGWR